jgi:hypothetical protein
MTPGLSSFLARGGVGLFKIIQRAHDPWLQMAAAH